MNNTLFGREREVQTLTDLIDGVHHRGAALVMRGEAGVGKTALLAAAARYAAERGARVLRTTGVQSETSLSFASLHELLIPVLPMVDGLPAPQRDAIRVAFGQSAGDAPDLFLVGLATLSLLAEASARAPLLLLADDSQWFDRSTTDVMAFVARRLEAEPIVMLITVREGNSCSLVLSVPPELRLRALGAEAAAALLDAHAPGLAPALRERVLREAAGNPLALTELPGAFEAARLEDDGLLPPHLPLSLRLERAFAARTDGLPAATRTLLLVAATDEGGVIGEVLAATSALVDHTVTLDAAAPAIAAGLIGIDGAHLRFRHPLVRSTIYQGADPDARRAAHAALAAVLAGDPDRRVWHRAASALGPDEDVASELDEAATRAQQRGGIVVAVAALERAAELTEDGRRRGARLVRAAGLAFELGRPEVVARLLGGLDPAALAPTELARVAWVREMAGGESPGDPTRIRALVRMADLMSSEGATDLALSLLWAAASSGFWADRGEETRDEILATADRVRTPQSDPRLLSIYAYAAPIQRGAVVIDRISRWAPDESVDPGTLQLLGNAAATVGAFDLSEGFLSASIGRLREQGRLVHLAQVLVLRAWSEIHLGRWRAARADAEEASRLAQETAQIIWGGGAKAAESILAGLRGEEDDAEAAAAEAERIGLSLGARAVLAVVQLARGLNALGAGRHAEAYAHLRRMFDPADPAHHHMESCWAIGSLAEAAAHSGHRDEARELMERLEPLMRETPSPWFHVAMRHARALLAADADADALYCEALGADLTRWPFERARLEMAYGAWLRRRRRVAESKAPLRTARDAFDAFGANLWGERARQELRAAGEASRRRTSDVRDALTPQELQIAQMAAEGMSNKEIGQHLFLSYRTVGTHLYRLFPKLGITTRSHLRRALERGDDDDGGWSSSPWNGARSTR